MIMDDEETLKELIKHQYKVNLETRDMFREALGKINETNQEIKVAIQLQAVAINNIEKFWGKIVLILVMAVSLLAGAEKVVGLFLP